MNTTAALVITILSLIAAFVLLDLAHCLWHCFRNGSW